MTRCTSCGPGRGVVHEPVAGPAIVPLQTHLPKRGERKPLRRVEHEMRAWSDVRQRRIGAAGPAKRLPRAISCQRKTLSNCETRHLLSKTPCSR